jgi:hypothetical protein
MSERGLELGGVRGRLEWEPRRLEPTAFEGATLVLSGAPPGSPELSWRPELADGALPPSVELALEQFCAGAFFPYRTSGDATRYVAALGNRAGWTFHYRFRSPVRVRLAVPEGPPLVVRELTLVDRLPLLRLPPAPERPDLAEPVSIPLPPDAKGFFRLVLLTPMQVLEEFATDPAGSIEISARHRRLLRLVARLAPGSRIHYIVDRLARPGDRASTLERSAAGWFEVR